MNGYWDGFIGARIEATGENFGGEPLVRGRTGTVEAIFDRQSVRSFYDTLGQRSAMGAWIQHEI